MKRQHPNGCCLIFLRANSKTIFQKIFRRPDHTQDQHKAVQADNTRYARLATHPHFQKVARYIPDL